MSQLIQISSAHSTSGGRHRHVSRRAITRFGPLKGKAHFLIPFHETEMFHTFPKKKKKNPLPVRRVFQRRLTAAIDSG